MRDQWLALTVDRKLVRAVVMNFTAAIDVIYHFWLEEGEQWVFENGIPFCKNTDREVFDGEDIWAHFNFKFSK